MRVRWLLAMWATIAMVVGVTVVLYDRLDMGGSGGEQVVVAPDGTPAPGSGDSSTTAPAAAPGPGQVLVSGQVTGVHLEGAVLEPRTVPTPLTVTSNRGFGNGGELTSVLVDGTAGSIVWDGGRPFVLSSGGALVVEPVPVDLAPDGLHLGLGGGAHALVPGTYRLDTPVAVGTAGIATPRDAVTFEAVDGSLFEARGDANLVLDPSQAHRFLGPGLVHMEGSLALVDPTGTTSATEVAVEAAAFDLTFTASADGTWHVEGVVDDQAR